jgi:hypothetical protein
MPLPAPVITAVRANHLSLRAADAQRWSMTLSLSICHTVVHAIWWPTPISRPPARATLDPVLLLAASLVVLQDHYRPGANI